MSSELARPGRAHAMVIAVLAWGLVLAASPSVAVGHSGTDDHDDHDTTELDEPAGTWGAGAVHASGVDGAPLVLGSIGAMTPPVGVFPPLNDPPVAATASADGSSYWIGAADGGVFAFGDADFHGSMGSIPLNEPVVAMATTASGQGYWLAASDGGIFAFGDADFHGSMGSIPLNEPVVAMSPTGSGHGYWMVASDGGVFAFGDADFYGSLGSADLDAPIVDMALTPTGDGYWLVTDDGEVFPFGDAPEIGSAAADRSEDPVTAIVATATGLGYHLITETGLVIALGDATPITTPGVDAPDLVIDATAVPGGLWMTVGGPRDHVVVWESGGFSSRALAAVTSTGADTAARTVLLDRTSLASKGVRRGDAWVQQVPDGGWRIQFSAMGVPAAEAATVVGSDVAAVLAEGDVVLSARSARFRGARAGDDIVVYDAGARLRRLRIGVVAPDRRLRGAEIVMSASTARSLGVSRAQTALLIGPDPAATLTLLRDRLPSGYLRSLRAGDSIDSDPVLSSIRLKEEFGEVVYLPGSGSTVTLASSWVRDSIVTTSVPIIGRLTCNTKVIPDLTAALQEIRSRGLTGLIDIADSRRYGGCWVPRLIRGASGGFLSRHGYGIAIDINPSTNRYGATPTMDPRIVEIFRANGFAWGGGWTRPDGMHFEWVGRS